MAALQLGDDAFLFVTNVLNGTVAGGGNVVDEGTVLRIALELHADAAPTVKSMTTIGSGFAERTDPNALVIGPTGLGLAFDGTLYVADSLNNRIAAIPNALTAQNSAGTGKTVKEGRNLNDPLGLAIDFFGDVLTVNGNNGFLVVTTARGDSLGEALLDSSGTPPGSGALFGLAVSPLGIYYVDDATNTLNIFL
jgi:sugar lactone lactonase YvrE